MTMENVKQADKLAALPIISVEPFLHPDGHPGKLSTAAAFHAACSQYGFFYLDISSYADPSEPEELTRLAREFFALPPEKKDEISISNEDGARGAQIRPCLMICTDSQCSGYQRLQENVTNGKADNHEAIDYFRPVDKPDKTKPLGGENQWPAVPGFKEKYEAWVEKMKKLGMIVMEA